MLKMLRDACHNNGGRLEKNIRSAGFDDQRDSLGW
jgi:hypothetical protein